MITCNQIIELKRLIEDYEGLRNDLNELSIKWNNGDPSGDISMQYCKENEIEDAKFTIESFVKELYTKITD